MNIHPIKTRVINPPQDDLFDAIKNAIKKVPDQSVLVVTSKVVSISEGRCIPTAEVSDKLELVKQEADKWLSKDLVPRNNFTHTIKNGIFIAAAGIDASNANGYYVLWPQDPFASARKIHTWIKKTYHVRNLGVVISDSRSTMARRGTIGIALGWHGFEPLIDYRNTKDLFGRRFKFEQLNLVDSLATASLVVMGEGNEQTPLALITEIPNIKFGTVRKNKRTYTTVQVSKREDKYLPFYGSLPWRKGGGGMALKKKKI